MGGTAPHQAKDTGKPQTPAEPPYSGHGDTSSAFLKAEVIPAAGWQGGRKKAAVWKALEQEEKCWEAQHLAQLPGRLSLMFGEETLSFGVHQMVADHQNGKADIIQPFCSRRPDFPGCSTADTPATTSLTAFRELS